MYSMSSISAKVAVEELRALATPPKAEQGDACILPVASCGPIVAQRLPGIDHYLETASKVSVLAEHPTTEQPLPKRIKDSIPYTTALDAFVASPADGAFDYAIALRSAKRQLIRQRTTASETQQTGKDADGEPVYTPIHIAIRRKSNLHIRYRTLASKMPTGRMGRFAVPGKINPRTGQRSMRSAEPLGDRMARRLPAWSSLDDEARDVTADAYTYWLCVRKSDGKPYSEILLEKANKIAGTDGAQRLAIAMAVRAIVRRNAKRLMIGRRAMQVYSERVQASTMARLPFDLPADSELASVARCLMGGMTKRETARFLGISTRSVFYAVSRLRILYVDASLTTHETASEFRPCGPLAEVDGLTVRQWRILRPSRNSVELFADGSGI